jgi:hypothetical protein
MILLQLACLTLGGLTDCDNSTRCPHIRKTGHVPEHVAPSGGSGTPWSSSLESLEHSRGSRAVEHVRLDFLMHIIRHRWMRVELITKHGAAFTAAAPA